MMTRGRKPKPTAQKKLAGNPGKRALPENEPVPPIGLPEPPAHLDDVAKAEYFRVGRMLEAMKLVTPLDGAMLAIYAQNYSRWVDAENNVRELGFMVKSPNGFPVQNPYLAVANRAMREMRGVLVEFGMSPSSRTRVRVLEDPQEDPEDARAKEILD